MKIFCFLLVFILSTVTVRAQVVQSIDKTTGAVSQINIEGDKHAMNWLCMTDGSQYAWCNEKYQWGLGYFSSDGKNYSWQRAESISDDGCVYRTECGIEVDVKRIASDGNITESYTFVNTTNHILTLDTIGIYLPMNDNYAGSEECIPRRCNVHIWDGWDAGYVCAMRMGGEAPHLGLMMTDGSMVGYDVWQRGPYQGSSHQRGVFALRFSPFSLKPRARHTISWRLFAHQGYEDFLRKVAASGGITAQSDRYTLQQGDTAHITLMGHARRCRIGLNGKKYKTRKIDGIWYADVPVTELGENEVNIDYGHGMKTRVVLNCVSSYRHLIQQRVKFIVGHQQMNKKEDPRYGALMVYDNEGDSLFLNNTPSCSPADRDEGAERLGMGVLLAKHCLLHHDTTLVAPLVRYANFLRQRLQKPDGTTYSSVGQTGRNRGYNYPWVAQLYFHLYLITGEKQYATDGYNTMQAMYRYFNHGFYTIGTPVVLGLHVLAEAGMKEEYNQLLSDYRQTAEIYMQNGVHYPPSEVNYEQSIVAPCIQLLLELYSVTGDSCYLRSAQQQMPVLESFNGHQPSYHLSDIAIRHWDGYWFGKREMFGDTFPHYWSCITAAVFHLYARLTGDDSYQHRAQQIVYNNLCNFEENGRGHCAYLYPLRVDGQPGRFYDPYANDQDWALVFLYQVTHDASFR